MNSFKLEYITVKVDGNVTSYTPIKTELVVHSGSLTGNIEELLIVLDLNVCLVKKSILRDYIALLSSYLNIQETNVRKYVIKQLKEKTNFRKVVSCPITLKKKKFLYFYGD